MSQSKVIECCKRQVASMVAAALNGTSLSREEVAQIITTATNIRTSKYMLDAWSSESRDTYNIPFYQVIELERVCETRVFSSWLAEHHGGQFITSQERVLLELGRLTAEKRKSDKQLADFLHLAEERGVVL